jgi:O-antigen ligase
MGKTSIGPLRKFEPFAAWVYHRELLKTATLIFLATIFFSQSGSEPRTIFFAALLPLAGIGLLSPARNRLANSFVLWSCLVYLLAMCIASAVQPDAPLDEVWRQFRLSTLVFAFILMVASLVACHPHFLRQLFLFVGIAVAISAAFNIYLFFEHVAPARNMPIEYYRLKSTIGMPSYANSTNLSATYAVFFMGTLAMAARTQLSAPVRSVLALAAAVLFVAVVLTQTRGALVAVTAGMLVLALTALRRDVLRGTAAVLLGATCTLAIPAVREALFIRGSGHRFEVWSKFWPLIEQRPFTGYGSFSPLGITLDDGTFLDQAHNLVVSSWFRGGIVSAAAMACILVGGLYWAWRYWQATREITPLCVMVTITTAGMFDYQLLITYPTWPWVTFWLPFGLCSGAEMASRNLRPGGRSGSPNVPDQVKPDGDALPLAAK